MWERLIEALAELLKLYQVLLTLSKQKHGILIAAKAIDLEAVTKQEEQIILQIGKLEIIRENAVQEIMIANNLAPEELTISKLIGFADSATERQLIEIWHQFDSVIAELAKMSSLNSKLLEQALLFVNFNINILTQSTIGPTYAAKGSHEQTSTARTVLDRKV